MRKFYLSTMDKSHELDLNTPSMLATNPQGLGVSNLISYMDTDDGEYVSNVKAKFDPISFEILFNGDGTNGYANYATLSMFLSQHGKKTMLLRYDDGISERVCKVHLRSLPKTEIKDKGEFKEKLTLDRLTYWYKEHDYTLSIGTDGYEVPVSNPFFNAAPVEIIANGSMLDISIYVKDLSGNIVAQTSINKTNTGNLHIDPDNKKITLDGENAYSMTDKSKQSFLYIPTGNYVLGASVSSYGTNISATVKEYSI